MPTEQLATRPGQDAALYYAVDGSGVRLLATCTVVDVFADAVVVELHPAVRREVVLDEVGGILPAPSPRRVIAPARNVFAADQHIRLDTSDALYR